MAVWGTFRRQAHSYRGGADRHAGARAGLDERDADGRVAPAPCASGGSGFRVQGSGCRVQGSGCRVQGSGCRVHGSGFRSLCGGTEAGSYLRLIDSCITQGTSRTCNESKEVDLRRRARTRRASRARRGGPARRRQRATAHSRQRLQRSRRRRGAGGDLQQRVVREKTPGPSCPQTPAGGLSTWSCWSCNY